MFTVHKHGLALASGELHAYNPSLVCLSYDKKDPYNEIN